LPDLLSWIVPLTSHRHLGLFLRRMTARKAAVMSFARSRAKILADDEVKVRFSDVAGVRRSRRQLKELSNS